MELTKGILPWTRSCFVCGEDNPSGLHLRSEIVDDRIRITYTTRDRDVGYRHIVHGGIMATLMDEVMTWAAIMKIRTACVAAEINIRMKKPVEVGQEIIVEGWVEKERPRILYTQSLITDTSGKVLLKGAGKYMPMPSEGKALCEKDFVVHPDSIHPACLLGAFQK